MPQGPEEEKWLVEYSLQAKVTGVSWELWVYPSLEQTPGYAGVTPSDPLLEGRGWA